MDENDDENINPLPTAFSAALDAVRDTGASDDPNPLRDPAWLRWAKFISVIAALAILFGVGFLVYDYVEQSRTDNRWRSEAARRAVERDSIGQAEFRFAFGASVGGGLGILYVARCVLRKIDP